MDTVTLKAGIINVNSNIRAGGTITGTRINATSMMTIQNQPVATQAWVNEKYASFATVWPNGPIGRASKTF